MCVVYGCCSCETDYGSVNCVTWCWLQIGAGNGCICGGFVYWRLGEQTVLFDYSPSFLSLLQNVKTVVVFVLCVFSTRNPVYPSSRLVLSKLFCKSTFAGKSVQRRRGVLKKGTG